MWVELACPQKIFNPVLKAGHPVSCSCSFVSLDGDFSFFLFASVLYTRIIFTCILCDAMYVPRLNTNLKLCIIIQPL